MTERAKKQSRPACRKDTRFMGVHVPASLIQQVKILAAERETTNQGLFIEFLKDGLKKYGKTVVEAPHKGGVE